MQAELSFLLIATISTAYAFFSILMSNVYGNRARVKEIQERISRINREHAAALARGDKVALARAEKAQREELPALLKESLALQFKPLLPTLAVFLLLFYYVLPAIAPDASDDVTLQLFDDGLAEHCDASANDGTYSACYVIPANAHNGTWIASARAVRTGHFLFFANEERVGENATLFLVGSPSVDHRLPTLPQHSAGTSILLQTDNLHYAPGDTIAIAARMTGEGFNKITVTLDMGTRYWVDAAFDIPFLGRELHPTGLFILLLIVSSLLLQALIGVSARLKKVGK
ncbi:MAG: hypothetical protein QXG98_04110 [Candidatus Micrarchaeia archaeon]